MIVVRRCLYLLSDGRAKVFILMFKLGKVLFATDCRLLGELALPESAVVARSPSCVSGRSVSNDAYLPSLALHSLMEV